MVGIYRLTSPSGRVNIGQSWDIERRKKDYLSNPTRYKTQRKVVRSMEKYGPENHIFEVLQEFPNTITQEYLDDVEILFIAQYKECGYKMMNIREGGSRGKVSEETKRIQSNIRKGKPLPALMIIKCREACKGRFYSEETRQKLRIAASGKTLSEEAKQRISVAHKERMSKLTEIYKCPYCDFSTKSIGNYKRYHDNKCIYK